MVAHVGQHVNNPGVHLPRSAQICREASLGCLQVGGREDPASVDRYPRVLVRVLSVLGSYGVLLLSHGLPSIDVAALYDNCCVPEDEVNRTIDVAFPEELPIGVDVECILVPEDATSIDHRVVGPDSEGHRLVLPWPRIVLKRHVPSNEAGPCSG